MGFAFCQVEDLCQHLEMTTKAAQAKDVDKDRTVAEIKAMHELDVDQLKRRIRELQEKLAEQQSQALAKPIETSSSGVDKSEQKSSPPSSHDDKPHHRETEQATQSTAKSTDVQPGPSHASPGDRVSHHHSNGSSVASRKPWNSNHQPHRAAKPLLLHVRFNKNIARAVENGDSHHLQLWQPEDETEADDSASDVGRDPHTSGMGEYPRDSVGDDTEDLLVSSADESSDGGGYNSDNGSGGVSRGFMRSVPLRPSRPSSYAPRPSAYHPPAGASTAVGGGFGLLGAHRRNAALESVDSSFTSVGDDPSVEEPHVSFESEDTTELLAGRYDDEVSVCCCFVVHLCLFYLRVRFWGFPLGYGLERSVRGSQRQQPRHAIVRLRLDDEKCRCTVAIITQIKQSCS